MSGRRIVYGAVVAALTLAAAGCSSDSSTTDTGGSAGGGSAAQTITIKDFTFNPSTLTVNGSTTIEVTNDDDTEHSFTLDDDSVSQDVQPGTSETVTIDPAASIGWHCNFHPTMTGSITVG